MSQASNLDDATKCPLCGEANMCAVAGGRAPESCWCMTASIAPEVVAKIPPQARGRVCICPRCAGEPADAG
jgi:hypothetical protein